MVQAVPSGIGRRIRHLSYSDQGGRPDGVQVMVNRRHVYVGHMFSDGVTILDATDPRRLKPVGFFTAGVNTRTHHLQVADDVMLLANGANIVAMQSYDNLRGYFENALVDSITNKKKFRSGLSIHDISRPGEMREIAFLEIPGFGVNRLSWMGGRYAYLSAHFDGFTDHIFCIVDLKEITKPEIVSRWWLPGMHRAGGEKAASAPGKRVALHHCDRRRQSRVWRLARWRPDDSRHQRSARRRSSCRTSTGRRRSPAGRIRRCRCQAATSCRRRRSERGALRKRHVPHVRRRRARAGESGADRDAADAQDRDFCAWGTFGPHNLHENRPGSFRSEDLIFATYNNAGVRVFDIKDPFAPKEIASWVPPVPKRLIDPRPNVSLAAKTADIFVTTDGLMFVSDWNAGLNVLQYEG